MTPVFGRLDARPYNDHIKSVIRPAPRLIRGELPRKSPAIWRFRNMRYRNQVLGTCVGQSGAACAETTVRTPDGFTDATPPNPPVDFSPLDVYVGSRLEAEANGVSGMFRGEGSIVSYALLYVQRAGFIPYEAWPCTPENEKKAQGRTIPAKAQEAKRFRPYGDVRNLVASDQMIEYMAAGYSLWPGTRWLANAMQTRADGSFTWSGSSVGGHAYELLGYDLDADRVWIGNSWDGWGGPGSIGWTKWSVLAKEFTDRKLAGGESECCVFSNVDGWGVKTRSWIEAL